VISYSGGKPPKTLGVQDLAKKARIWWNDQAKEGSGKLNTDRPLVTGIQDFDIVPVYYPLTAKANPNNGIYVYYRGFATDRIEVPVLTQLVDLKALSKRADGKVEFDPSQTMDNDDREAFPGARGLAGEIEVTATYQAYNVPSVQKDITLRYKALVDDSVAAGATNYEPYYTFNKDDTDASYEKAYNKWYQTWGKHKGVDVLPQNVTVGHSVEEKDFTGPLGIGGPTWTAPGGGATDSNFPNAAKTGAYIFTRIPDFTQNLVRDKDRTPLTGFVTRSGWEWVANTNDKTWTGTFLGSGVKSKAKTSVISVDWLVND